MTKDTRHDASPWLLSGDALRREIERSGLNRRALLRRGMVLGLAAPIAAGTSLRATTAAPSRQDDEKGGDGTLIVSQAGDPLSFNPDFQVDDSGFLSACNIYSMLLTLDGDYNLLPELAETWEVSDDGLAVTFNLVSGAVWHDGEPVTAADVKFSLEQIMANESAPANSLLGPIESVDAVDDTTVVLNLSAPSASLVGFLGWYGTFILPAHIYEGSDWTTNEANQSPVGSGPFRFASYTPGSSIDLEANFEYFADGPYVDRLIFQIIPDANTALQALLNGEIDLVYTPSPPLSQIATLQETPGIVVGEQVFPSVYYLGFQMETEPTSNLEVRRALAQVIDRQQILDTALGGYSTAATTFYTSVIAWASNTSPDAAVPELDLEAAAAALDAAGYPVVDGTRFTLVLPYFTDSPEYADIAAVIREQLRAVNVESELVALEIGAWGERMRSGDFDIGLIDGFQGPDPANLRIRVGTGGAVNHWRFSDPEVDALLDEGDALSDQDARAEIYFDLQRILAEQLPILPLANYVGFYPYTDRATGFYFAEARGEAGLNRFTLARIEAP